MEQTNYYFDKAPRWIKLYDTTTFHGVTHAFYFIILNKLNGRCRTSKREEILTLWREQQVFKYKHTFMKKQSILLTALMLFSGIGASAQQATPKLTLKLD